MYLFHFWIPYIHERSSPNGFWMSEGSVTGQKRSWTEMRLRKRFHSTPQIISELKRLFRVSLIETRGSSWSVSSISQWYEPHNTPFVSSSPSFPRKFHSHRTPHKMSEWEREKQWLSCESLRIYGGYPVSYCWW